MNSYCPECDRQFERGAGLCPHDNTDLVPVEDDEDPLIGEVLEDRYRIDAVLGSGGMGKVYRATQLAVDRNVAVKILRDELSGSEAAHERFSREAQNISSLSHPNIVQLIDFGRDANHGAWFLVMEHVEGQSLGLLLEKGRLHYELALEIVYQVCAGLADAHDRGMVHRDLKPENLHLTPVADGTLQVKLLDFGIARCVEQTTRMTRTDQICGTPAYVAPEQAAGSHEVDIRADFFALGVVLFEMLTGHLPFRADGPLQLMFKNAQQPFPKLADELSESAPVEQLQALLDSLTAKQPGNRPDSPAEIRSTIEGIRRNLDRPVHRLSDQFTSFDDLYQFVEPGGAGDTPSESPVPNRSSDAFARTAGAYQTVQPNVDPTDKHLDRADTPPNAGTERGVGEPVYAEDRDDVTAHPEQADPNRRAARAPDAADSTRRPTAETPQDREATNRRLTYGVIGLSVAALALGGLVVLVGGDTSSSDTTSADPGKRADEAEASEETAKTAGVERGDDESSAESPESDGPEQAAAAGAGSGEVESSGEGPSDDSTTNAPSEADETPPSAGGNPETSSEGATASSGTDDPAAEADSNDGSELSDEQADSAPEPSPDDKPDNQPPTDSASQQTDDSSSTGGSNGTTAAADEETPGTAGTNGDESTGTSSDPDAPDESEGASSDDDLEEMLESGTLRSE